MFLNWIQYLCSLFVGTCADQRADDLTGRHQGRGLCPRHSDAEVYPASVTAAPLVWMITAIMGYFLLFPTLSLADLIINNAWLNSTEITINQSVTVTVRTTATIEMFNYYPAASGESIKINVTGQSPSGSESGPFVPMPVVSPFGSTTPFELSNPLTLNPTGVFHVGEPLFLRITDGDQNLDPTLAETIIVTVTAAETGDREVLQLTETGPDTGIFTGYLGSTADPAGSDNGLISLVANGTLTAHYADIHDGSSTTVAVLVDPIGLVFDSSTGQPIDGVPVTLVDVATGLPATVFGDDGVSSYPSSVISGATTTDSSGHTYIPPAGGYRFPLIAPGHYRFEITPPAGYTAPSTVSTTEIQTLPGAPFAIEIGSRGEDFAVNAGPTVHIDTPIDPGPDAAGLWVKKEANKSWAAIGDFIAYHVTVLNAVRPATDVIAKDTLPLGFSYQKGSTRIDGKKSDDPKISSSGRTLTYHLGDLPSLSINEISYVIEVAAGAKLGEQENTAFATSQEGLISNTASAIVNIREDFMQSKSLLMGRVMVGSCEQPDTEMHGLVNAKIYLEDGTYVVTDEKGKYHFEGIEPGTHVVQLDLESLPESYETVTCEENTQFAGRNFSQFIDLQGGTMWRADFHVGLKEKSRGKVSIELNGSQENGHITFRIPVQISTVPLRDLRLKIQIPQGLEYIQDSSRLNETDILTPEMQDGALIYHLNDRPVGWNGIISLQTKMTEDYPEELSTRAFLTFNSPDQEDQQTPATDNLFRNVVKSTSVPSVRFDVRPNYKPLATELSSQDKEFLDQLVEQMRTFEIDKLYAIGHTDNLRITQRSLLHFADNFVLSAARARNVAEYLATALNLPPEKVISVGVAGAVPIADNATAEGRSLNRRVEIRIEGKKIDSERILALVTNHSAQTTETIGLRPGEAAEMAAAEQAEKKIKDLAHGILYPQDNGTFANRISSVRINLDSKLKPRLTLDGLEISTDQIGFKMVNPETDQTLYTFIGIDFGDKGNHLLKLEGIGPFGNARFEQEFTIIRTGEIAEIRVLEVGNNIADGITPLTVRLQLLDSNGKVINSPAELPVIDGNLKPEIDASEYDRLIEGASYAEVDAQGYVRFQPTNDSGLYYAILDYGDETVVIETYVKPYMRDWIMVGFAEGTAGYNTLSGNQTNLDDSGIDDHFYTDDQVKFFAKGTIKGEWLLTMAYDSDKENLDAESLQQIINPDSYYPLYGDETQQGYEASSARKIYVKLEREQFYALFGDMQTNLNQTELSRYNRIMNGFKSEMQSEHFEYTVFAAETRQGFVKDEIRGDGTSGRYYLSQQNLVINSEEIVIETRDRFRSENIIASQSLQRYLDYTIDYNDGTIFFKQPISSRDGNLNPTFIVVRYETRSSDNSELNYGGRAAVKLLRQKVEIGATHIHEKAGTSEGNQYGADATIIIDRKNELHLEASTTNSEDDTGKADGEAWLAELVHSSRKLHGKLYYRQQDSGFGLGQQNNSETGTRKYGAEGNYRLNRNASLSALAWHEDNLDTDAERDVMELSAELWLNQLNLRGGLLGAKDRLSDNSKRESLLLLAGAGWTTADNRLTLRADHEQALAGQNENSDYPTLTLLGADYRLNNKVSLFVEEEFTWGERKTETTRAGLKATPWNGGDAHTSVAREIGENGQRVYSLFGLRQTLQVSRSWIIDVGVDRSYTFKDDNSYDFNTNVPSAHGSDEDFTSVSMGANYQQKYWSWDNRAEVHHSDSEDKYNLYSGLVGELSSGISASARYRGFYTDREYNGTNLDQELTFGLAFRPTYSRWILLNRLDAEYERDESKLHDYQSWRLINNLHANLKVNRKWQIAPYYGLKYVRENFSGSHYSGFTDLLALETRYNLSKKWDVGLHGSMLHSWNSGQLDLSVGASVGRRVMTNVWISVGYNIEGFRDDDFSTANYTAQGAFVRFRMKFDQQSVKDALSWVDRL